MKLLEKMGMTVIVHAPEQSQAMAGAMQPVVVDEFLKTSADAPKLLALIKEL
ncbi:hypothetical protein D3C84_1260270 [compost metagenome]